MSWIEDIRDRTNIGALIGEYVELGPVGVRGSPQLKGPCPFHADSGASLHVHPVRRFFHCFECKESGDCFAFVMKLEARTFPEAVSFLAERLGIALAPEDVAEREIADPGYTPEYSKGDPEDDHQA